jgi:hypothetical protein
MFSVYTQHLSLIEQVFSSPDPKGHVSYSHHLASVVVVRRKLFQKSSPLKVLDQWGALPSCMAHTIVHRAPVTGICKLILFWLVLNFCFIPRTQSGEKVNQSYNDPILSVFFILGSCDTSSSTSIGSFASVVVPVSVSSSDQGFSFSDVVKNYIFGWFFSDLALPVYTHG